MPVFQGLEGFFGIGARIGTPFAYGLCQRGLGRTTAHSSITPFAESVAMFRSLATTVALAVAAIVFTVATAEAGPLSPVNIYGNLGTVNASTTSNTVGYLSLAQPNQFQAQGFSVGNQLGSSAWDIQEIQVGLGSSGVPSPVVAIYSDFASINGPVPGTPLATFSGTTAFVSGKGIYTFTGSFTALENTSYWVVLACSNAESQESYEWYTNDAFTQPTQQNASNVTYLGTKERNGVAGSWTNAIPSLSIGINAVAVPEPPTYALAMVAGVLGASAAARQRSKKS